jgi:phospholipid N-methyltransferase
MQPSDRLDCFELNTEFAAYLEDLVAREPEFAPHRDRIAVHVGDAKDARIDGCADFVICSVPLNNLPGAAVSGILDAGRRLLAAGGWFTYFEYVGLPRLRRLAAPTPERDRLTSVRAIKSDFRGKIATSRLVVLNIPPARAVHVPIAASTA